MPRQALTPERPVERFADRVVDRLPGPTEIEQHAIPVGPVVERRRGELRAVVALNDRRQPARLPASLSMRATSAPLNDFATSSATPSRE